VAEARSGDGSAYSFAELFVSCEEPESTHFSRSVRLTCIRTFSGKCMYGHGRTLSLHPASTRLIQQPWHYIPLLPA